MLAPPEPERLARSEQYAIEHFFPTSTITVRMFNALARSPMGLSRDELMWAIYRGKNEPDWTNVIGIYVCKFNRRARELGLGVRIRGVQESGWRYRIFVVRPR